MKPYYDHAGIQIFHGDCRGFAQSLGADLLVTDPPYGMNENTRRASAGRGKNPTSKNMRFVSARDWDPVFGDDEPFDPAPWLTFHKVVLFAAIHYSDRLPKSRAWLVWDKREGTASDDNADCDFAWTNLKGPARLYSQLWRGICRRGEENISTGPGLLHPTQKPVNLMQWVILQCKPTGCELLLDPYMGSGSTLLAAKRMGISAIGIEIEEKYCEIAALRLQQSVFDFPKEQDEKQGTSVQGSLLADLGS